MSPDDIRARVVTLAQSVVGLGANRADPASRQQYIDLIAPGETDLQQANLADNCSGCGLVVAGIWRALGVTAPELEAPYKTASGVSRLVAIARRAGAWVAFSAGQLPSPGDAVLVGDGPGEVEHIYTVISVATDEGVVLQSIDGGQRDDAHQETILAKQRVWKARKDLVVAGTDPGAASAAGRTISGWIDVTALPIAADEATASTDAAVPA